MKLYRILNFDFDSREHCLSPVQDTWDAKVKELHIKNQEQTIQELKFQYGELNFESKIKNFRDLRQKPFSVLAFHNLFLEQIRISFVMGVYYPALTGACALGERILNHLMLILKDYYKSSKIYKKVYRKNSFDYWPLAIEALTEWDVLLPDATQKFSELYKQRNYAIHFNQDIEKNTRDFALKSILLLQEIIAIQFSMFMKQPWVLFVPGEVYIKHKWERKPFIQKVFLPNAAYVGPKHFVKFDKDYTMCAVDINIYSNRIITDDEFCNLRVKGKSIG